MKSVRFVLVSLLILALVLPVYAAENPNQISSEIVEIGNGLTMINEVYVVQTRSTDKIAYRRATIMDGDTIIAQIEFEAVFRYDGRSVSVVSKTVTQTDTYANWNYREKSFTSSGGTVTLEAKLTKFLIFSNNITMSLHCDANGNITHS